MFFLATHVSLGRREAKLEYGNLGILHPHGTPRCLGDLLREDQALDELRVIDGATELLHDLYVVQIGIVLRCGVSNAHYSFDGKRREEARVLRNNLHTGWGAVRNCRARSDADAS